MLWSRARFQFLFWVAYYLETSITQTSMIRLHAVWDCIKYFPAQDLFLYSDLSDPHSNLTGFLPTALTQEDCCPSWQSSSSPPHSHTLARCDLSLINILRPLDISKWICQNIIIFVMLGLYWHVYTSPGQPWPAWNIYIYSEHCNPSPPTIHS